MASVSKRKWPHKGIIKESWIVRWKEASGSRGQKTFKTKKEADKYRLKVETEIEQGTIVENAAQKTVAQMCDLFLEQAHRRRDDGKIGVTRLKQLEQIIRLHIKPVLGSKNWNDLEWSDIDHWHAEMAKPGRTVQTTRAYQTKPGCVPPAMRSYQTKVGCSPRTRRVYQDTLNQVEQFALRRKMTKKRTVADYQSDSGGVKLTVIRTFTAAEVKHLLAVAEERVPSGRRRTHAMLRCFLHLAALCGLLRGEIMGLTRSNINFQTNTLRIRHSLTVFDELKGPKTAAGKRDVPMPPHVAVMLREWLATFFADNDRDLVFRKPGGDKFWAPNFFAGSWRPLLDRAGLLNDDGPQFHFHALRHFAASWMIENGLSLPDVAAILGHAKFDMTLQVYAHSIVGGGHRHAILDRMAGSLLALPDARASHENITP